MHWSWKVRVDSSSTLIPTLIIVSMQQHNVLQTCDVVELPFGLKQSLKSTWKLQLVCAVLSFTGHRCALTWFCRLKQCSMVVNHHCKLLSCNRVCWKSGGSSDVNCSLSPEIGCVKPSVWACNAGLLRSFSAFQTTACLQIHRSQLALLQHPWTWLALQSSLYRDLVHQWTQK